MADRQGLPPYFAHDPETEIARRLNLSLSTIRNFHLGPDQLVPNVSEEVLVVIRETILEGIEADRHRDRRRRLYSAAVHEDVSSTWWAAAAAIERSPTEDGTDSGQRAVDYNPNISINDITAHIDENAIDDRVVNSIETPDNGIVINAAANTNAPSTTITTTTSSSSSSNPLANTSLNTGLPESTATNFNTLDSEAEQDHTPVYFQSWAGVSNPPSSDVQREISPNYEARLAFGLRDEEELVDQDEAADEDEVMDEELEREDSPSAPSREVGFESQVGHAEDAPDQMSLD